MHSARGVPSYSECHTVSRHTQSTQRSDQPHHTARIDKVPCADCQDIPVDSAERATRCTFKLDAVCQCSGCDGTSWPTVTRPPSDDGSDVEHGQRATYGVQAARHAGRIGTAGSRLMSRHASALSRRRRSAAMSDRSVGEVARRHAHRTSKTRRCSHRRECL